MTLREAAERATPGKWRWWTSNSVRRLSSDATGKDGDVLCAEMVSTPRYADIRVSDANMAYIAAADPTTVLALLDDRDRLQRERDDLKREWRWAVGTVFGNAGLIDTGHSPMAVLQDAARGYEATLEAISGRLIDARKKAEAERDAALALAKKLREAIINLRDVKGRYHAEIAYKRLMDCLAAEEPRT